MSCANCDQRCNQDCRHHKPTTLGEALAAVAYYLIIGALAFATLWFGVRP